VYATAIRIGENFAMGRGELLRQGWGGGGRRLVWSGDVCSAKGVNGYSEDGQSGGGKSREGCIKGGKRLKFGTKTENLGKQTKGSKYGKHGGRSRGKLEEKERGNN